MKVPENATVYLQDQKMSLTGKERRFLSPKLAASRKYVYTVKVEVEKDGKTMTKTTKAKVQAGQTVEVAVDLDQDNAEQLVSNVRAIAQN